MSDGRSAQFTSLFNGLITLSAVMAKRGLFDAADVTALHSAMTKPLDLAEHAHHEGLAEYRILIDNLISTIASEVK